ncbi:pilus assembly protein [Comamonas sp. J-3]|uniref:pilus assembly protein n=1 Tax=Comamonas trifloxystrobinivorans TaxID=3350256 RepID=UPI00372ABFB8
MPTTLPLGYRKTWIALAACAALVPRAAWSLDLATAPPGTVVPYVAPNVIVSIDDSGSMNFQITNTSQGQQNITEPGANGVWNNRAARVNILKYALDQVFSDTTLLPDNKIRLAWQAMHNNAGSAGAKNVNSASMQENSMRPLDSTHRANFLKFVKNIRPNGGTPTHLMLKQADEYMRRSLSVNSPWASIPGKQSTPYLACRRNYHIVFTDGRWNGAVSGGSRDNNKVNFVLPDGTAYGSTNAADQARNRLYSDSYADTLADWAFYSWSTRLQSSGLTGEMQPDAAYVGAPASENFGKDSVNRDAILQRYWNPKYNPATWPHMVTYTIGISNDATTWPSAPSIIAPTEKVPFGYDGSFQDLVTGHKTWPVMNNEKVRALDLWHAALNGRGRFYSVMTGQDLEKAFRDIIGQINTQTEPSLSTGAVSGANSTQNAVGVFTASYEPKDGWLGSVKAYQVSSNGQQNAVWNGRGTSTLLDARGSNSRAILTWGDTVKRGVPFRWAADEINLSTAQKAALQTNTTGSVEAVAKGQERLSYIRGDRSKEQSNGGTLRNRVSVQGDIVNSEIWYVGKPSSNYAENSYLSFVSAQSNRMPMLYVGGNDGMLHGFAADDGSEKFAYVPRGVIPNLSRLSDLGYDNNHRYFVDGSPMTGDVNLGSAGSANWRTLLVGTLGAGGKGYFVLDVTDPASGFAESKANQVVVMDKSLHASEGQANCAALAGALKTACETDADMGHITAQPVRDDTNMLRATQITQLNNNRWAVVLGNGYNSANGRPVLLIQYLDGAKETLRLVATGATTKANCSSNVLNGGSCANITDNGLSAPRLVDINGDGRPDVAYAGDNKGNMWKFLLSSDNSAQWGVAQWGTQAASTSNLTTTGTPLYTAKGGTTGSPSVRTLAQPITAAPTVRSNERTKKVTEAGVQKTVSVGGLMVAFGTGRNVSTTDPDDNNVQSIYSVLDNTRYKLVGSNKDRVQVCASTSDSECSSVVKTSADLPRAVSTTLNGPGPLVQHRISSTAVYSRTADKRDFWTVDAPAPAAGEPSWTMDWNTYQGWYLDLPELGERLLNPMDFYSGSNMLAVFSRVPARGSRADVTVESCESGSPTAARQYLTLLNIMDGKRPSIQVFDTNNDGVFSLSGDLGASRMSVSAGPQSMLKIDGADGSAKIQIDDTLNADFPEKSLRPTWRQPK